MVQLYAYANTIFPTLRSILYIDIDGKLIVFNDTSELLPDNIYIPVWNCMYIRLSLYSIFVFADDVDAINVVLLTMPDLLYMSW